MLSQTLMKQCQEVSSGRPTQFHQFLTLAEFDQDLNRGRSGLRQQRYFANSLNRLQLNC
jgi:hypothetical protein